MMKSIRNTALLLIILIGSTTCIPKDEVRLSKTFVLVAGAWQGAWVWQEVRHKLEQLGQQVRVVELPAHGEDVTPPQNVSIEVYRDKVVEAINAGSGQVTLVGHSMAGAVITATAEKIPGKIERLVYIGAFIPANGQSLLDLFNTDAQSLLGPSLQPSPDNLLIGVVAENLTGIFCQDCPPEKKQLLVDKFRPEPAIPFTNPVSITAAGFGSVDKFYIHTRLDRVVGPDLQSRMVAAAGITQTYSLKTGHSPFLSRPNEVTALLLKISR